MWAQNARRWRGGRRKYLVERNDALSTFGRVGHIHPQPQGVRPKNTKFSAQRHLPLKAVPCACTQLPRTPLEVAPPLQGTAG